MRTLDRSFLANNPAGDQKTGLTLRALVPARVSVPDNPDGTRPSVTFKVDGDTYMAALAVLGILHEDGGEQLLQLLIDEVVTSEELEPFGSIEAAAPLLKERVNEVTTPFRTFEWSVSLEFDGKPAEVDFELTAPSLAIGIKAVVAMTAPEKLTGIAIGLCPEADEDEDYSDGSRSEVLVVS